MGILSPTYRCVTCGQHTQAEGFGAKCVPCWSLADAERMAQPRFPVGKHTQSLPDGPGSHDHTKFFGTTPKAPWVVWRD
jgi:hypothetical protein